MQRYRSGHNGADSKSVWEQSHEGSNPSRCATSEQAMYRLLRLFLKVRARSRRCSSFPNRNRLRWVAIWVRRFAADLSCYGEISILTVPSKTKGHPQGCPFVLDSAVQRRLHPSVFQCSAEVNSACAEVLPAAKRSYGAKAPQPRRAPARRPVGVFLLTTLKLKRWILTVHSKKEAPGLQALLFCWIHIRTDQARERSC